jgi:acetylornithine deacetylase/succinyl-diaminopimelate desuccinylase-like protein
MATLAAKFSGKRIAMSAISIERAARLLSDLVAVRTVNPMGRPYASAEPVERQAVEYIADLFRPYQVEIERLDPSPIHQSLLITVGGRRSGPYTLLESHMDTVPADDWPDSAFLPRLRDGQLFGRGACDAKGSLAAMILAVQEMLEASSRPPLPVALLAAGDEEHAQTGIRQFAALDWPLARAVIGEPTRLQPILQHKGVIRWDITVHGRSAHSSQPELGRDAIAGAMRVAARLEEYQRRLRETFVSRLMTGPTITVTMIHGGRTRNAVADECTLSVDFRVLPGMPLAQSREELISSLTALGLELSHSDVQVMTPPLATAEEDPFALAALEICRRVTGRSDLQFAGAPYGTDAAWVADRASTIVLGPGGIESAHAVDEHIELEDVVCAARIYHELLMSGS